MQFKELGICSQILTALDAQGYETPSPIQEQAIPAILSQHDLLGCAQTGSGKTAAFAIPILQLLWQSNPVTHSRKKIRTLILTPTRELAVQINDNFIAYSKELPLRSDVVVGGVNQNPQVKMLARGTDILIATPGRLNDLIKQRYVNLDDVEIFVLDEADRMLDMGFIKDVKKIIAKMPEKKQTLLFSATLPSEIQELINTILHDYVKIIVSPESPTVEKIDQYLYHVDNKNKKHLLFDLLAEKNITNALVFTRTKYGADALVRFLLTSDISAQSIHSGKSQRSRQDALKGFKNGKTRVLVATDIAARGIDIEALPFVFNFDLPEEAEIYVHRIGRTGRAGNGGTAITFSCFAERNLLRNVERLIKKPIPVVEDHAYPIEDTTVYEKPVRSKNKSKKSKNRSKNKITTKRN